MKPILSVIIPTYNEETRLPIILSSLKQQTFKSFEIIVADNHSKDKTRSIAKKAGAIVCDGGLPASGRNAGARKARAETMVFLDADVTMPKDFLEKNLTEFNKRRLGVATAYTNPDSKKFVDWFFYGFWNFYMWFWQRLWPHAGGWCIFAKAEVHRAIRGFDETILVAEDMDYVARANRISRFGILHRRVLVAVRRLESTGRLTFMLKLLKGEFYRVFRGEIRDDRLHYSFGGYEEQRRTSRKVRRR